jgi:hypothetical protein
MATQPASRTLNAKNFKSDLSPRSLSRLVFADFDISAPLAFDPNRLETLSIAKPMGKGRTNLTLIRPDIVQTDPSTTTPVPFAGFDLRTGQRAPAAQFHFRPSAYGITITRSYVATFFVECFAACGFELSGFAGSGSIANAGTKNVTGKVGIKTVINNLPANQDMFAVITQKSGTQWSFFEVQIDFPSLVLRQP